jgi:ATP-binding cassette subfamily G (WHITE) protein 2 (PDR)
MRSSAEVLDQRLTPEEENCSGVGVNVASSWISGRGRDIDDDIKDTSGGDRHNGQIGQPAKTYASTTLTSHVFGDSNPFDARPGCPLDPASSSFDFASWTRAIFNVRKNNDHADNRATGFCFRNLTAYQIGPQVKYQKTVGNAVAQAADFLHKSIRGYRKRRKVLYDLHGTVQAGEMLLVLGPLRSGCSTFLKTIAGKTKGLHLGGETRVNYHGVSWQRMHREFPGEAIYVSEEDIHFPHLTVGDTLYFAARARVPRWVPGGVTAIQYATCLRNGAMAALGIFHTINTKVGNEYVRGVSGGERKRVSIAEAFLSGASLQCWDNSTRGLDSANALEFCRVLQTHARTWGTALVVLMSQSPQAAYDMFDKVILLYEGRQIYFGDVRQARRYFIDLGFQSRDHQTDAEFLTSMTNPRERIVRDNFQGYVPRTPDEFAVAWRKSVECEAIMRDIDEYENSSRTDLPRPASLCALSYTQQVYLCIWRSFKRLIAGPSLTLAALGGNFAMSLIIGSVFYNLEDTTESFYSRGVLLFFATLMSAFSSALEILIMYEQRRIVEKHAGYVFYRPSAEAIASSISDLPYKIINAILFNSTLYFMAHLRREPGAFFIFFLFSFLLTMTMSVIFRAIASISKTLHQALVPASLFILAMVMYAGYAIPTDYMLGWARWINYVDPVAYGFEALMINEFSGREFLCALLVPPYGRLENSVCYAVGSESGQSSVSGDSYLVSAYGFEKTHLWRNFGIIMGFIACFFTFYIIATDYFPGFGSNNNLSVYRYNYNPPEAGNDPEDLGNTVLVEEQFDEIDERGILEKQESILSWRDICYEVKIKGEPMKILSQVDGFIKRGTLTALMGVSGAGKTTLFDVLADRVTTGVISGEKLRDGRPPGWAFQRRIGYAQQQDLHLETSTVREALIFSAMLRQPAHIPSSDKIAYADKVINLLGMNDYADAVVGTPQRGLNIEQRKKLTIGVELAAKPDIVFLDEPTTGLDSQAAWSIVHLLEKLKRNGLAILCTVHQPSASLFHHFDRLLLLNNHGEAVYFGPSETMIDYFERNGAEKYKSERNPAEWMLDVIGAERASHRKVDWPRTWRNSPEIEIVHEEIKRLEASKPQESPMASKRDSAPPFWLQLWEVQKRTFQQHWRSPGYIYSKFTLCIITALFVGFSFFRAPNSIQGMQDQMFGLFMLLTIFGQLVQQILPLFVAQRTLYEARERPSQTFSWQAFMLCNITAEVPWNILCAVFLFVCWYYPIGLFRNAEPTHAVTERGALMWLLIVSFLMFTSTFAHMIVAGVEVAATAGNIANTMFIQCLTFCG